MPIFNKIIALSKQLAASILNDEKPNSLKNSEIFSEKDKNHIIKHLTDDSLINERKELSKKIDKKADWEKVKSKIKVPVRKLYWRYTAAAVFIGVLASSYLIMNTQQENTPIIVNNNIKLGTDKATLTLDNGKEIALEKGTSFKTQNASSNGEELVYDSVETNNEEIAYNYLTIPRGGQFFIKLADGTKVWLNSETKFKYPVSFVEGDTRKVELVYGEAYFDVSPSTAHNDSKFVVITNEQEIEVLGTEFNIKAYKDEVNIITTLVHGKVGVNYQDNGYLLEPNQQSNIDLNKHIVSIQEVDVENDISWKEGIFSFDNKTLKEIMIVLSRWYDFDVEYQNSIIENVEFVGVLSKNQNIEDILYIIKNYGIIKNFEINDKKIIIK